MGVRDRERIKRALNDMKRIGNRQGMCREP
jgi:hypothetical protein